MVANFLKSCKTLKADSMKWGSGARQRLYTPGSKRKNTLLRRGHLEVFGTSFAVLLCTCGCDNRQCVECHGSH